MVAIKRDNTPSKWRTKPWQCISHRTTTDGVTVITLNIQPPNRPITPVLEVAQTYHPSHTHIYTIYT